MVEEGKSMITKMTICIKVKGHWVVRCSCGNYKETFKTREEARKCARLAKKLFNPGHFVKITHEADPKEQEKISKVLEALK